MAYLVGITGPAGSGKDTLADMVEKHIDNDPDFHIKVGRTSLAGPLRRIAKTLGLSAYDRAAKEKVISRRFKHFELSLIEAINEELSDVVVEDDRCELYAHFVTKLRDEGFLTTRRQDVLTISPRQFCQLLGTEGGRAVRKSFWIDVLLTRADDSCDVWLIPDVRFLNEARVMDSVLFVDNGRELSVSAHSSETHFQELRFNADHIVPNVGDLTYLEVQAEIVSCEIIGEAL